MIASQAVSTVIMPLLIVLLLIMLNSSKTVGSYKNPTALNVGLIITLAFALLVSYSGALGLIDSIRDIPIFLMSVCCAGGKGLIHDFDRREDPVLPERLSSLPVARQARYSTSQPHEAINVAVCALCG